MPRYSYVNRAWARFVFGSLMVAALAMPMGAGASSAAAAPAPDLGAVADALPAGWGATPTATGGTILTLSPVDLSLLAGRDARVEFRLDGALLGYPTTRPAGLQLVLPGPLPAAASGLSAWIGSTRLDAATPLRAPAPAAAEPEQSPSDPSAGVPIGSVDPAAPGKFRTERRAYALDPITVAEFPQPIEVEAEVISPVGASGKRPLVLFLHGRHYTCYDPAADPNDPDAIAITGDWPCPAPMLPVPSHQGYRYVAEVLASQGYVTVSISANGINGQDGMVNDAGMAARSVLTRHHLALWEKWSRQSGGPFGRRFVGKLDMSKVVLVGHSRGGEGVERAAIDAVAEKAPYTITGLALIGPTSFGRQTAPGVHTAVLLPYCDGDVSDLQGQAYVDNARDLLPGRADPALHAAVMLMGTNHNFYNTEWTTGQSAAPSMDDWLYGGTDDDPNCGAKAPERLSAVEQQAAGAVYIAALVRLAASADQAMVPYLDGALVRAASAGRAQVFTHAIGANHTVLYRAGDDDSVTTKDATADLCLGYGFPADPAERCGPTVPGSELMSPHFLPMYSAYSLPSPKFLRTVWDDESSMSIALPEAVDLRKATHVDVRFAVEPGARPAELKVTFVDTAGKTKSLRPELRRVRPLPPGGYPLPKLWAFTLRVDVKDLPAGMRKSIKSIGVANEHGDLTSYILDISSRTATVGSPTITAVPRIDVSSTTVNEGSTDHTEQVTLTLSQTPKVPARVWVEMPDGGGREVVFQPGTKKITIPVVIHGNTTWDSYLSSGQVAVVALANVTTGNYFGGITVIEDDPAPTMTITPVHADVVEGAPLEWQVTLSEPITQGLTLAAKFREPTAGPELSTYDFSAAQRELWWMNPDDPDMPFSSVWALPLGVIEPGGLTATVSFTPEIDGVAEGTEYFDGELFAFEGLVGGTFSGSVRDA